MITNTTDGPAHGGTFYAFLDGYATNHTDTVAQSVAVPSATTATLTFWLAVATEDGGGAFDKLTLTVEDDTGSHVLARYSNLDDSAGDYSMTSLNLTPSVGKTVVVRATGVEDSTLATAFFLDDFNLATS